MFRPTGWARSRVPALAFTLAGSLLSGGCGDSDTASVCPPTTLAIIEGTVMAGGEPVRAELLADGFDRTLPDIEARTDSTGFYRITLPEGSYWLTLNRQVVYTPGGPVWQNDPDAVPLEVPIGLTRADFVCGQLEVHLPAPEELEGSSFELELWTGDAPARPSGFRDHESVRNGACTFSLPAVPPGAYRLLLKRSHEEGQAWLPSGRTPDEGDLVIVGTDAPVDYAASLPVPAHIMGRVRGSWQTMPPFSSSMNILGFSPDSAQVGRVRAEADGSFDFAQLWVRPVRLLILIDDVGSWIGGRGFEEATTFDLEQGQIVQGIERVESGILCRLRGPGYVTDQRAELTLIDEAGAVVARSWSFGATRLFSNLDAGLYRLHVKPRTPQRWLPQWYDGSDSLGAATAIVVPEGGTMVPITVHLVEGGAIEGRLLQKDGSAAPFMVVFAAPLEDPSSEEYWDRTAQVSGSFRIEGLPAGVYRVHSPVGAPYWYPGTADMEEALPVVIDDHAVVTGIEWTLPF